MYSVISTQTKEHCLGVRKVWLTGPVLNTPYLLLREVPGWMLRITDKHGENPSTRSCTYSTIHSGTCPGMDAREDGMN